MKIMIIDGQEEFRALLSHHLSVRWPDAVISGYDPTATGHLPPEFSGAGSDIVLLGDSQGDRDGLAVLRQFLRRPGFPPLVYFGSQSSRPAQDAGASAYLDRDAVVHDSLVGEIDAVLRERMRAASSDSFFIGDAAGDIHPLVRGFRFIERLGSGECTAVYLAEKESDGTRLALKVLRQVPDLDAGTANFDRFLEEYELIAGLNHPNIARIFDFGVSDDHAHIAMEYVSGGDLRQRLKSGVTEAEACQFARQIAAALAELHGIGILHRDLKPGNVMLREDGTVALIDFGLARRLQPDAPAAGSEIIGTPWYMSPEQGRGSAVDERSDVYALGVIFYEMLTGSPPFTGNDPMTVIFRHRETPVPILPRKLARFQGTIDMLLAKDPADRPASADLLGRWL